MTDHSIVIAASCGGERQKFLAIWKDVATRGTATLETSRRDAPPLERGCSAGKSSTEFRGSRVPNNRSGSQAVKGAI